MKYLREDVIELLDQYQIDKINKTVNNCLSENEEADTYIIKTCPKCGITHDNFVKGGFSSSGKQMIRCKCCEKKFVVDHGQLTFHSHQKLSKWNDFIILTTKGESIKDTAVAIDVSKSTCFRMRHKLMNALNDEADQSVLKEVVETDDTFVFYSHKGKKIEGVKGRERGGKESKRGLSDEQVCIIATTDRHHCAYAQSYNLAKPSKEEATLFVEHIEDEAIVMIDGLASYRQPLEDKNCNVTILKTHKKYSKEYHLNTVNSFHRRIKNQYEKYRSVASKYINRYAALFKLQHDTQGMSDREIVKHVTRKLRKRITYFFIRELTTLKTFDCVPKAYAGLI